MFKMTCSAHKRIGLLGKSCLAALILSLICVVPSGLAWADSGATYTGVINLGEDVTNTSMELHLNNPSGSYAPDSSYTLTPRRVEFSNCNGYHHSSSKGHGCLYWNRVEAGSDLARAVRATTHIVVRGSSPIICASDLLRSSNLDYLDNVVSIDVSGLNTEQTRVMAGMFKDNPNVTDIRGLSLLKTGNAQEMSYMFASCTSLKSIDLSSFDTSKVGDETGLFDCMGMDAMFSGCSSLASLNVSNFDTSNVKSMEAMFHGCSSLRNLNLRSFDTSNVDSFEYMFSGCSLLTSLDLSNFDLSAIDRTEDFNAEWHPDWEWRYPLTGMFDGCDSLQTIKLPATGDFSKAGLPSSSYRNGSYVDLMWRNEKGQMFEADAIPARTAGTYTAVVVGGDDGTSGDVGGVSPQKTSLTGAKVTVKARTWTGKAQRPAVTVKLGGRVLRSGADYTVSYKSNKNVGTAKVTVTGKGSYMGTKIATFKINPKGTSVKKLARGKKSFTVTWKRPSKSALKQTTGYQVRWSLKKSMKGAKSKAVKVSSKVGKKCSLKVSKLKGGKRYYVQVRTYKKVGGKTYYSSWSKAKAVKTRK